MVDSHRAFLVQSVSGRFYRLAERLTRAGVTGYNKPKRTPGHPKKSHIVVAKEGDKVKTIRFGEQGAKTAGKPKAGESEAMKKATDKLEEALKEFVVAVQDAKVRKEEPVKEVKGPAIVTPEKEKPVQAEQK